MGWRAALLALLFLAPAALAGWSHDGGDGGRVAVAPDRMPWSVIAITEATAGPGSVLGADGEIISGQRDMCGLRFTRPDTGTDLPLADCEIARPQALRGDHVVACLDGTAPAVALITRAGATAWTLPLSPTARCDGAAIDSNRGILYVPEVETGVGFRLLALDVDAGRLLWNTSLSSDQFLPRGVTVTTGGIAVSGSLPCNETPECGAIDRSTPVAAARSYDRDGIMTGQITASGSRADGDRYATSIGSTVWLRLGQDAVRFDPLAPAEARLRIDAVNAQADHLTTAPVPVGGHVLFGVRSEVIQVGDQDARRGWTWPGHLSDHVLAGTATGSGSAWLIDGQDGDRVVVLDRQGTPIQQIPLPGPATGLTASGDRLVVFDDDGTATWIGRSIRHAVPDSYYPDLGEPVPVRFPGAAAMRLDRSDGTSTTLAGDAIAAPVDHGEPFVVTAVMPDGLTHASRLQLRPGETPAADSAASLALHVSDLYPPVGRTITIAPTDPTEVNELWLQWGDRTTRQRSIDGPVQLTWQAALRGPAELLVTAVDEDGLVRAARLTVDVGGTPADPSFWDQAFAPENQDMTWGIIGVGVALLGGGITIAVSQGKRRKTHKLLERVDAIRGLSRADPMAALQELTAIQVAARSMHERARIDDAQYQVLRDRCQEVLVRIVGLSIDPVRADLPGAFIRRFEIALRDGVLDATEADDLERLLQGADPAARRTASRFLESWRTPDL